MLTNPFEVTLLPPRVVPPVWTPPNLECPEPGRAATLLEAVQDKFLSFPPGGRADDGVHAMLMEAYEACPANATLVDEVGEGLRMLGEKDAAFELYSRAARDGLYHHPLQRILTDFEPDLRSAMLLERDAWEELPELYEIFSVINGQWRAIRAEFFRARKSWDSNYERITQCKDEARQCWRGWRWAEGTWGHFFVAPKAFNKDVGEWRWDGDLANCKWDAYPTLCHLLHYLRSRGFEMPMVAITDVRAPRTRIPSHHSQQWRLRFVCPLFVPRNATSRLHFPGVGDRLFLERDCFWFDESYEHEQIYDGATFRSALLLDLKHPGLDGRPPRGDWASHWWNTSKALAEERGSDGSEAASPRALAAKSAATLEKKLQRPRPRLVRQYSEIADETGPDTPFCWQNGRLPSRCCGFAEEAEKFGCWKSSPALSFATCCGTDADMAHNIPRRSADAASAKREGQCGTGGSSGMQYLPSVLERAFAENALEMTSNMTKLCQTALNREARSAWLRQIRGLEPISEKIFSRHCFGGQTTFIEPLGGILRDPRFLCEGLVYKKSTDWLLVADRSFLKPKARKIFLDAGGSRFRDALHFFLAEYASRGIVFDEVIVWEARLQGADSYWAGTPPEVRAALEPVLQLRDGVKVQSDPNSPDNPIRVIEEKCSLDDFCVFKLDIDQPTVEGFVVGQLLESTKVHGPLVDEFFFEHHVRGLMEAHGWAGTWYMSGERSSETFADSYKLFSTLRESGIRAHSWI